MNGTMKLLQIIKPGQAAWIDFPIPQPQTGEVLVKVLGVTTCPHWDLHLMDGLPMFPGAKLTYPYTPGQPGHEATGEIVALGPGVTGLTVGARVVAWRDPGHHRQGCYAQYVPFQAEHLLEIPSTLETTAIASLELAMCVQVSFDQLAKLDAIQGKRVGVSGLGPAGLVAVQMAHSYGASQVIGIDPLPERRQQAAQLGADRVVAPGDEALPPRHSGAQAMDTAIDCTGLKASVEFLMDHAQETVALFGVLREEVPFGFNHWRGLALLGYGTHNRPAAQRALQLVLEGKLDLRPLVTHTLPFTQYVEGIELLRTKQAIKVCFLP